MELHIFTNCTDVIRETNYVVESYNSFCDSFGKIVPTIWLDTNPNTAESEWYKNFLQKSFPDSQINVTSSLSDGYIQMIDNTDSDFIFVLEHDWKFLKENIKHSLSMCCDLMVENSISHLRFQRLHNASLMNGVDGIETVANDPMFQSVKMAYNNPHIVHVPEYRKTARKYISVEPGSVGIEDRLSHRADCKFAVYGPLPMIEHLDGRNSDHWKKNRQVIDAYLKILQRIPDQAGFYHYVNSKFTIDEIESQLLNSTEYTCKNKLTTFDSTEFVFHTHDCSKDLIISKCIHDVGSWESNISWIILNAMKAGGLFVDIGANIGWHTKVVQNRGHDVIAFEPEPENFKLLMKNCDKEGSLLKNVALGDKTTSLFLHRDSINYGDTYVTESGDIKVDSVRLDDVLDKSVALRTSVVKMDTQGYETKIIQGGLEFFKNLRKGTVIVTEVSVWRPQFDLQLFLDTLHSDVTESYTLCHWWNHEPKSLAETLDFISNTTAPTEMPNYFEFDLVIIK